MSFDVERAIASLERRDNLRFAEECGAWTIRRSKTKRERSKNERETCVHDALSCLHGVSYTMICIKCRRDKMEASTNLAKLKRKLSIT
jgi:hypothetical protein